MQVAPGSYAPPTVERKTPITLVAARPAVGDDREPIAGPHSIIAPQAFSAPTGTVGATAAAPWTPVALTGPATGAPYTVWKCAASPANEATHLTVAPDQHGVPQRVAYWDRKSGTYDKYTLSIPEGWAEVLYKNATYNYGFASFGADIYLRLPGDRDPNTLYVTPFTAPNGSSKGRIVVSAPDVRLSGFEIRTVDLWFTATASRGVVDHNLFFGSSLTYRGESGPPATYSTDWSRVGAEAETTAIGARGGARQTVIRYNTIDGFFNGVGVYNEGFDRYSQADTDIHDNLLHQISDDSFEPEQQAINWRIWNNRLEEVSTALSTGPVAYGPIYFFRNEVWRLGSRGVGTDGRGDKGVGIVAFKFSGQSKPAARIYVINNTFWTDQPGADGGNQYAGGGKESERFYLRNNIFRMTRYAFSPPVNSAGKADCWDEDYNFFFTSDPTRGLNYGNNRLDVATYRAASDQGAHANIDDTGNAFRTEPMLTDGAGGNLTPSAGSPQIDAGVPMPNINDRAGIDYRGNAPDLGARERP